MNLDTTTSNGIYTAFNGFGVLTSYFMMALTVYKMPVDLSTKGIFGMGVFMLTLALVNFVKYRMDDRASRDRIVQLEEAKNEKILTDFVSEK